MKIAPIIAALIVADGRVERCGFARFIWSNTRLRHVKEVPSYTHVDRQQP
jgi:hypothetical protein